MTWINKKVRVLDQQQLHAQCTHTRYTFSSNHNIHKSWTVLCFWAPGPFDWYIFVECIINKGYANFNKCCDLTKSISNAHILYTYSCYKTFLGPYYFSSLVLVGIPSDSETILGNLQCNSLIMFFSSKLELHTNASTFFIECSTLAMLFKQFLSMFISFSSWHTALKMEKSCNKKPQIC